MQAGCKSLAGASKLPFRTALKSTGTRININDKQVEEICQQVRDVEVEIHGDSKEAYTCILKHYGGDHPLSARLANPSGGALHKAKKLVNNKVNSETRWFGVSIISRFVSLCLLHFDYVKDIGKLALY